MIVGFNFFGLIILCSIVYWLIPGQRVRNAFISIVSLGYIFYYDKSAAIIVVSLTLITYFFAFLIEKYKNNSLLFPFSVISLVLVLIVFKYSGMLIHSLNSFTLFINGFPQIRIEQILLPLGLSYLIFKLISYLTDIHWGLTSKGNLVEFFTYTSMFTIFVAGPIERFERMNPQIKNRIKFDRANVTVGFERIVLGLFKKAVIADWIGFFIHSVWENPNEFTFCVKALALIGYALQLYMDFAGYSDIAIGASRLFGIKIMENFNNPYLQQNISQFWRSWHISLSDWIRDYVFFPLSRLSGNRTYNILFVPIIAMAVCGLWHGSAWHFALWGMWHGAGIAFLQYWNAFKRKNKKLARIAKTKSFNNVSILLTFTFVTIGWLWFL